MSDGDETRFDGEGEPRFVRAALEFAALELLCARKSHEIYVLHPLDVLFRKEHVHERLVPEKSVHPRAHGHLAAVLGEQNRILQGGVRVSHETDVLPLVEGAVAHRAVGDSRAHELFLSGQVDFFVFHARRENDRAALMARVVRRHDEMSFREFFDLEGVLEFEFRAEVRDLLEQLVRELAPGRRLHRREVLHPRGTRNLSAHAVVFEHQYALSAP